MFDPVIIKTEACQCLAHNTKTILVFFFTRGRINRCQFQCESGVYALSCSHAEQHNPWRIDLRFWSKTVLLLANNCSLLGKLLNLCLSST